MHEMSFAEGIATVVVNPRIRLSVQLTNILMQPRHLGGESLQGQMALRTAVRDKKWGATFNEKYISSVCICAQPAIRESIVACIDLLCKAGLAKRRPVVK